MRWLEKLKLKFDVSKRKSELVELTEDIDILLTKLGLTSYSPNYSSSAIVHKVMRDRSGYTNGRPDHAYIKVYDGAALVLSTTVRYRVTMGFDRGSLIMCDDCTRAKASCTELLTGLNQLSDEREKQYDERLLAEARKLGIRI